MPLKGVREPIETGAMGSPNRSIESWARKRSTVSGLYLGLKGETMKIIRVTPAEWRERVAYWKGRIQHMERPVSANNFVGILVVREVE